MPKFRRRNSNNNHHHHHHYHSPYRRYRRRRHLSGRGGGGTGFGFITWLGPLVTVVLFAGVFLASVGQSGDLAPVSPKDLHGDGNFLASVGQSGGLACMGSAVLDAPDIELYIHQYTNEQRVLGGLEPLRHVTAIDGIARAHSEDMAARNYFSHDTLEGLDPTARGERAGYGCTKNYGTYYTHGLGENIFQYNGIPRCDNASTVARYTVSEWMQSPGHRANIMDQSYDELGVGVAFDGRGSMYATQNFC